VDTPKYFGEPMYVYSLKDEFIGTITGAGGCERMRFSSDS